MLFETNTYPLDHMISAWERAIRTYQGNQEAEIPMMTLFKDGPRMAVMKSGKTKGRKERKPSVMRITTSSVLLLDVPENMPMGTPIIIDNKTTPKATFNEDIPA